MSLLSHTLAGITLAAFCAVPATAEFQLGERYTDADGDLIADIPTDVADQLDPSTLIFAYTPVEDPRRLRQCLV